MSETTSARPRVAVYGLGYVGLAMAVLLARKADVTAIDIDENKIDMIAQGVSPLIDADIVEQLPQYTDSITATATAPTDHSGFDFVVIATPTNYDPDRNYFDTSSVEAILTSINDEDTSTAVVIKSTIPIGYTARMSERCSNVKLIFSPEFLREGRALYDNLHPDRIVVSNEHPEGAAFAELLVSCTDEDNPATLQCASTEAEAIKLFANTFLATRVSFFNELDTYALRHGLDSSAIIKGVSLDSRIGDYYNNPSFGYGGYCLPKDSRQLLANYAGVPQSLITATVDSNAVRKKFIVDAIACDNPAVVGVNTLAMKAGSDNFRSSSVFDIISGLQERGIRVLVFDEAIEDPAEFDFDVVDSLKELKAESDVILANRVTPELADVMDKVFSRDIYHRD